MSHQPTEGSAATFIKLFSEFLRQAVSGFVLLFGVWVVDPSSIARIKNSMDLSYWPFLILGPVFGLVIYSIHRNLFTWMVYWLTLGRSSEAVRQLDVARWTQRHDPTHPNWGIVRELDAWSAQVDYLYTSAWALLAAPLLTQLIPESQANLSAPMLWLAGGLLIFAIAGDLRVIDAERTLLLKPVEPPKQ